MKKFFYSFVALVAAASVLSCQKEPVEVNTENEAQFAYQFNVANAETKAILADDAIGTYTKFEEGDTLGIYTKKVSTLEISYNRYGKISVANDQPASFNLYSHYALANGDYVYTYFPYVKNNSEDPTCVSLEIPAEQSGKMNSMPMVGVPFTVSDAVNANENTTVGTIYTQNLGGVFQFRIFSSDASYRTETVKSVEFTSASDIAGSFTFDITQNSNLEISNNEGKSITVTQDAEVGSDKSNGGIVNMVVKPGSYTGTLVVTTNVASYTFEISSVKSVERSHIKPLNVDLAKASRQDLIGTAFVKVESELSDWSGHYLIVFKNTDTDKYYAFNSSLETLDVANNGEEVTLNSDGSIALDENTAKYVFTVASMSGGYSVKASNGKYIYGTTGANTLNTNNDPSANTFTWNSSESYLQVAAPTYLTYNNATGQYRFRYMKTDNKNTAFYKLNGNFNPDFPTLTVIDQEVASNVLSVKVPVSSNRNWIAEITEGAELVENGTLTTSSGNGDGSIEFMFKTANTSVLEPQLVKIHVVAGTKEADITVTHKTLGAAITLSADQVVEANSISASFQVVSANFKWSVISATLNNEPLDFKEASDPTSGDYTYTVTSGDGYKGTITVYFPSNAAISATTYDKTIKVTVGIANVKTATHSISQSGQTFVDPNATYFEKVSSTPVDNKWEGIYLIVNADNYAANGTGAVAGTSVNVSENRILVDDSTKKLAVKVTKNGSDDYYTIKFANGMYMGTSDNNNGMCLYKEEIDPAHPAYYNWSFSYDEYAKIIPGVNSSRILKGYSSSQFRTYSSDYGTEATLYKYTGSVAFFPKDKCKTPVISCSSGVITINSNTIGARLYYTTDGVTTPSESSSLYSGPFSITETTTIKAIAIMDGYDDSEVATKECTIGKIDPITFTLDASTTGNNSTTYVTNGQNFTVGNVSFYADEFNPSSQQVKVNQTTSSANFELRNTSALPSAVKKITIKVTGGTFAAKTGIYIQTSSSAVQGTATSGINPVWNSVDSTLTWTFNGTDTYFSFGIVKNNFTGTCKFGEIKIEF